MDTNENKPAEDGTLDLLPIEIKTKMLDMSSKIGELEALVNKIDPNQVNELHSSVTALIL